MTTRARVSTILSYVDPLLAPNDSVVDVIVRCHHAGAFERLTAADQNMLLSAEKRFAEGKSREDYDRINGEMLGPPIGPGCVFEA